MRKAKLQFIVLLMLFSICANSSFASKTIDSTKTVLINKAPAVQISGPVVTGSDLKSSVILIDFWASWCAPCLKALPYYNDLYKKWKDKGLVVMAINLDDNVKDRDNFLKSTKLDFPIYADGNPKYFDIFDVQVVPTLYILDKNKRIKKMIRGFSEQDKKEIELILKNLLI